MAIAGFEAPFDGAQGRQGIRPKVYGKWNILLKVPRALSLTP
jgi:hypothetical protein